MTAQCLWCGNKAPPLHLIMMMDQFGSDYSTEFANKNNKLLDVPIQKVHSHSLCNFTIVISGPVRLQSVCLSVLHQIKIWAKINLHLDIMLRLTSDSSHYFLSIAEALDNIQHTKVQWICIKPPISRWTTFNLRKQTAPILRRALLRYLLTPFFSAYLSSLPRAT